MKTIKRLNKIYDKYRDDFKEGICSFHDLLWQIMINQNFKEKEVVFYPVVTPEGNEMVVASGAGGYTETGVVFKNDDWDKSTELSIEISLLVWDSKYGGLLENEGDYEEIMTKSMGYPIATI